MCPRHWEWSRSRTTRSSKRSSSHNIKTYTKRKAFIFAFSKDVQQRLNDCTCHVGARTGVGGLQMRSCTFTEAEIADANEVNVLMLVFSYCFDTQTNNLLIDWERSGFPAWLSVENTTLNIAHYCFIQRMLNEKLGMCVKHIPHERSWSDAAATLGGDV